MTDTSSIPEKFTLGTLAQSSSALNPPGTEEKRWVDGKFARKKGIRL